MTAPTTPVTPPSGARNAVAATPSLAFTPAEVTIATGDSVTWVFGAVAHTVVFQSEGDSAVYYGGKSSSKGAPAAVGSTTNAAVARVFAKAGTFNYRCTIHSGMTGEVHVQ